MRLSMKYAAMSRIVDGREINCVMAALGIYFSICNLFIGLLQPLLAFSSVKD